MVSRYRGLPARPIGSLYGSLMASVLVRAAGAVLALIVNIVWARMLGASRYGGYMTMLSASLLLSGLAVRGSDQLLTREISAWHEHASHVWPALRRWAIGRVGVGTAWAVAVCLVWIWLARSSAFQDDAANAAAACACLIVLSAVCMLVAGALNGLGASLQSQSLPLLIQNGSMLAVLGGVWIVWSVSHYEPVSALWVQVAGYGMALVIGAVWLKALGPLNPSVGEGQAPVLLAPRHPPALRWSKASRHFMLVTVAALLINRLDVVLVYALSGDETAGAYAAGARLAQAALLVGLAVNTVLTPRISSAWTRHDHTAMKRLVRGGLWFTVPISMVEVALAVIYAGRITALLGPGYGASAAAFAWVTVGYALWTVAAPYYALMTMTGQESRVAALSWLVLIVNGLAMLVLVPTRGAGGAGMAMASGYALALLALLTTAKNNPQPAVPTWANRPH